MVSEKFPRPLFVFGCYRSGTSLLRIILNTHPKIFIPEETEFVPHIGEVVANYGNLSDRANLQALLVDILSLLKKKAKWEKVPDLEKVQDFLSDSPSYPEVVRAIILSLVEDDVGALEYWGDKTPKYINSLQYLNYLYPDAKFINIIRDGRDVAASVKKEAFWGGRTSLMVAEEWNYRVLNGLLGELSLGKERFYTVQYEKLVSHPEKTLMGVTSFLGVEFDESMLMFYRTPSARKLTRFARHRNVMKPISKSSVGRYKKMLSTKELKIFENEAGNTLLTLGYDVEVMSTIATKTSFKLFDFLLRVANGVMHRIAVRVRG